MTEAALLTQEELADARTKAEFILSDDGETAGVSYHTRKAAEITLSFLSHIEALEARSAGIKDIWREQYADHIEVLQTMGLADPGANVIKGAIDEINRLRSLRAEVLEATGGMTISTMFPWGDAIPGNTGIFAKSVVLDREWDMAFNYDCIRGIAALRERLSRETDGGGT